MRILNGKNERSGQDARRGQMALILIFVIAAALILFAAALNWNRTAQHKALTTVAANSGASLLVSNVASYGEHLLQVQLGGKREKCAFTGLLVVFLIFIVLVILAVTGVFAMLGQLAGAAAQAVSFTTAVGIVAAGAAVVIQAAYIQPTITKLWNRLQERITSIPDRFLESGLNTALGLAQTDTEIVPDLFDYDQDGKWYNPNNVSDQGNSVGENISRYAFHYTQRLLKVQVPAPSAWGPFGQDVQDIWDLMGFEESSTFCQDNPDDSRCNPCCTPVESRDPECPKDPMPLECYPRLSYDPLFEARLPPPAGTPAGLLQLYGMDDDNKTTRRVQPDEPTSQYVAEVTWLPNAFRGGDTFGELFPFLYLMTDTYPDITGVAHGTFGDGNPMCMWCSGNQAGNILCAPYTLYWGSNTQLMLPHYSCVGQDCCVNTTLDNGGNYTLTDRVRTIDDPSILALNQSFMINGISVPGTLPLIEPSVASGCPGVSGIWRRGSDRGCYTSIGACPQHAGMTCLSETTGGPTNPTGPDAPEECGCAQSPDQSAWMDDILDDASDRMRFIYDVLKSLVNVSPTTINKLRESADQWTDGFTQGMLDVLVLADELEMVRDRVHNWRNQPGLADDNYWCLPTAGSVEYNRMTQDERDAIQPPGSTWAWDSLTSVQRCLAYNSHNYDKFGACSDAITNPPPGTDCQSACQNLPRSLVNGFDPNPVSAASCLDADYANNIMISRDMAYNQSLKFQSRARHLGDLIDRADKIIDGIGTKPAQLRGKVTQAVGVAPDYDGGHLADFLAAGGAASADPEIDNRIIYGWQSPPNSDGTEGRWHLVMAEANSTGRCSFDGASLGLLDGCNPKLPMVKTKTKMLGFVRCYYLTNHTGNVRMRVVRYDEDKPSNMLKFFNNVNLWDFFYRRPGTENAALDLSSCLRQADVDAGIGGAFMITGENDYVSRYSPTACEGAVNAALERGVASQTCAQYKLSKINGKDHLDMSFIPCP